MMALYRLLLHLLPASFRNEFGGEMAAILAERMQRTSHGLVRVLTWLDGCADAAGIALRVHTDLLLQDLRYAARTMARAPGFALAVVLVTGLGIGANTAVFTVADHVLVRPLPFANPETLVKVWQDMPGYSFMEFSPANFRDFRERSRSFEAMGAYYGTTANLVGTGTPTHVRGALMTPEAISILGIQPAMGRLFDPKDAAQETTTVLLSYGLWQGQFAGDSGILGKSVSLDGKPYEVVGVMPPDFHFPTRETDYWQPLNMPPQAFEDRNDNMLQVVARLRDGISLEQAQDEMDRVAAQLAAEYPNDNASVKANVVRMRNELSDRTRLLLWALLGASLCVLLIACTNLAGLLTARAVARKRELSVRTALGAGRERLVRQLFTESAVLALLGGVLGIAIANVGLPLLTALAPPRLPIAEPAMDLRVLAFTACLIGLTALAFGVYPAMRVTGSLTVNGLSEGGRSGVGGRKERLRFGLVVAEISVSVVLLVSAGLLMEALGRLRDVDPGFHAEGVMTLRTVLPMPAYADTARRRQFYQKVMQESKQLPGIRSAAYISFLPMTMTGGIWPVNINGKTFRREGSHTASLRFVTPGFFETLGIRMLRGRDISDADLPGSPLVAVVSRSLAERYWPDEDPLGREFEFGFATRRIVGVVEDIRVRGLEQPSEPQVYLAASQQPDDGLVFYAPKDLAICCTESPAALIPALRRIVREADPEQAVAAVRTLTEIVEAETESRVLQLRVLGAFAALALLLAGVGIHGLLAFMVSQRTPEIGVRIALGAGTARILRLVLRESLLMAAAGVILGAALGYMAGRSLEALLAGVTPASPLPFLAAVGTGLMMTLLGSLLPALRAIRVDPVSVIRAE